MSQSVVNQKKKGIGAFFIVLLILFCFYPYEFTSVYFLFIPKGIGFTVAMAVLSIALYLLNGRKVSVPQGLLMVLLIQFLGLFIHSMHTGQNLIGQFSSIFILLLPLFLILYLDATIGLVEFYRRYNKWILIMAIMGTIAWVLSITTGFAPLYYVVSRSDERMIGNYLLTFCIADDIGSNSWRYSGFFDEPGAMAYWGLYALIINKLFIKNNRLELVLSILLLFTFSLGYYVQLAVYLLLFNINTHNIRKTLLYVTLFIAFIVGANMTKDTSNSVIYDKTIGRVVAAFEESQQSDNAFSVDTRSELAENGREVFLQNPLLGTAVQEERIGNNVYEPLALYGLLGAPLVLFPFLYWLYLAISRKDRDFLKAFIVALVGFTHRPFHIALLYLFVIYSILFMFMKYGVKKENPNGKV